MNYKDYNDYELLSIVKDNDDQASEIIFNKYKPLIEQNARRMIKYSKYSGLEISDLIQEGMLGLSKAIKTFNDEKEASFYTYAKTCIERRQVSQVISSQRLKHKILNESLPFESYDKDEELINLDELIVDNRNNPESILTDIENSNEFIENVNSHLTDMEQQVFNLKISGFSYLEIADLLDKDVKAIDNAIQRIKNKIKELNK